MRRAADPRKAQRRAAILLVVLLMLTLFAVVGLSFVLYADSAATSSRIAREAESSTTPDVRPELLLSYFLSQLIYDADDQTGIDSALRGHSLGRLLYGWNPDSPQGNDTPFNGTGRLHEPVAFAGSGMPTVLDSYNVVNYSCFRNADGSLSDGLARDPERLGQRGSLQQPLGPYTGGFNAPYTYPDLNNLFLAAVRGDGQVLLPSYHRPWTGFGPLGPQNPNWYDTSKPWLKYLVLRPRPADMAPGFPVPESDGGDVKNLTDSPGGNDSIWLDLGFPVLQAADGRRFKPLFAPLVVDLDNRINLNVHGNVQGNGRHLSNQGWGPWEVNPGRVLRAGDEGRQVLLGTTPPSPPGRYGSDRKPGSAGQQAVFGSRPHSYAQVDFDAAQNGTPTSPFALPGFGAPPLSCFPFFPAGYGNASGGLGGERWEHPALNRSLWPAGDDRRFRFADLEAVLRQGDAGPWIVPTDLHRFLPLNFQDRRVRRMITTHSFDLDRPGVTPWLFDRDASAYQSPLGGADRPSSGPAIPFPSLAQRFATVPNNSDFRSPVLPPSDPTVDWRFAGSGPARLDLNRFLPPYPHQGQGLDPATYRSTPLVDYVSRFDATPAAAAQTLAAQTARQRLAADIYRRLLLVTGVPAPINPTFPTDAELVPRRWLAQLAVNIVDFLDEDEISTPFPFYTADDAGNADFDAGAVSAGNLDLPRYWVFGTELPRVVLNEVLAEYRLPSQRASGRSAVQVWVELFNPLPLVPPTAALQPLDSRPVPFLIGGAGAAGYSPYRVVLANTNTDAGGPLLPRPSSNDNILGVPDVARAQTTDADFTAPAPPGVAPQGFLVLGPSAPVASPALPAGTPVLLSPGLQYTALFTPPDTLTPDYRRSGLTVLLRRLANPYLPFDPRPALGNQPNPAYNPYQTVDYLSGIPLHDATNPAVVRISSGKRQPYAADPSQRAPQQSAIDTGMLHTFGRTNNPPPLSGHYDWLVHLDRPLISPTELLQVSGYPPHLLTQKFISPDAPLASPHAFNHLVPWFDQDNRLYRLFEFLATTPRISGTAPGGRIPGKVNINTIWDPETLLALCDPQPANHFTAEQVYNSANPSDQGTVFGRLLALRSPLGVPGPADRPFLGMAAPRCPAPGDPLYPADEPPLFLKGSGIEDTLLRSVSGGGMTDPRLFESTDASHPYLRFELLTKLFNNVTTRSNVFAVWLTVAFFEVKDESTRPVKLGAEMGREEGRHRRHRMFAIVDRTNLTIFSTSSQTAITLPPGQTIVKATVTPGQMTGTSGNGRAWTIQPGMRLTVDGGDNEETVIVTAVSSTTFTARFTHSHAAGFSIIQRGNPGPWPSFTPSAQPDVVPYWRVIN
ncbi:MAG TPA: hypothetical protein VN688_26250 [Gemmataceae bacterium]|nr:hypothetical protein [Gemmataceae bacterium]